LSRHFEVDETKRHITRKGDPGHSLGGQRCTVSMDQRRH
jgi:hypothetical protein